MLVCHCLAVNDRVIREQIEAGVMDLAELARRCGAGSECGNCVQSILGLMESQTAVRAPLVSSR